MSNENSMSGGWVVNPSCELPQEVATVFNAAMGQITGAGYEPLLYCGSQVVRGINYMIICKQTLVTKDQDVHVVKVVLNTISDESSIVSIERII